MNLLKVEMFLQVDKAGHSHQTVLSSFFDIEVKRNELQEPQIAAGK